MSPTDSIPPMSRTPSHGGPAGPLLALEERLDRLTIQVDRLHQTGKFIKWVATTAAVFALGTSLVVARMLYGWGRDDAELRADVRQTRATQAEIRTDLKELRSLTYRQLFKLPFAPPADVGPPLMLKEPTP